ncbi:MAG: hypothetical protein OEY34_05290 [Cyclobacteriaceae bacterium]|nr:hypothetical protein [Cyclobacteriaceae bacterium]
MKSKIILSKNRKIILSFLILFIISFVGMQYTGSFLKNVISPMGILSFEFGKTPFQIHLIINNWVLLNRMNWVFMNMFIDFVFIIAYSGLFWQLILYVCSSEKLKRILVFLPFIAGFFDIIENIFLLIMLNNTFINELSWLTFYIASIKFLLIGIVLIFIVFRSIIMGINHMKNAR